MASKEPDFITSCFLIISACNILGLLHSPALHPVYDLAELTPDSRLTDLLVVDCHVSSWEAQG
jgi:hypothetical protein